MGVLSYVENKYQLIITEAGRKNTAYGPVM